MFTYFSCFTYNFVEYVLYQKFNFKECNRDTAIETLQ